MNVRKDIYEKIIKLLSRLYVTPGDYGVVETEDNVPEGWARAIKHIDLWNHNVEFIEQEENWDRPAVFVEFQPIQWNAIHPGAEYRAEPLVSLHVVTDWQGSSAADSEWRDKSLEVFELLEAIHNLLKLLDGETFLEFDLVGSSTNHNHDELLENIETYQCVAIKSLR